MPAKTFKRYVAQVKRPSKCFEGWTTIVIYPETGREVALFAPTKRLLVLACITMAPQVEMDRKRFQKVAYFEAKRLSGKRPSPVTSCPNAESK